MYSETKYQGDDGSVGLELLANISQVEERSRVVEQAVAEGYFNFEEALSLYKITEQEYMTYFLLKDENKTRSKQVQFFETLNALVLMFHKPSMQFDPDVRRLMKKLEAFTKEHLPASH